MARLIGGRDVRFAQKLRHHISDYEPTVPHNPQTDYLRPEVWAVAGDAKSPRDDGEIRGHPLPPAGKDKVTKLLNLVQRTKTSFLVMIFYYTFLKYKLLFSIIFYCLIKRCVIGLIGLARISKIKKSACHFITQTECRQLIFLFPLNETYSLTT